MSYEFVSMTCSHRRTICNYLGANVQIRSSADAHALLVVAFPLRRARSIRLHRGQAGTAEAHQSRSGTLQSESVLQASPRLRPSLWGTMRILSRSLTGV